MYRTETGVCKVVPLLDLDTTVREVLFLAYLQGQSVPVLQKVASTSTHMLLCMEECDKLQIPQDITRHISKALQSLHEKEVLHRDVSPNNILVTKDKKLVLIDFGLTSFVCGHSCRESLSPNMTTITSRHPNMTGAYSYEVDWFSAGVCCLFYAGYKMHDPWPEDYATDVLPYITAARAQEKDIAPGRSQRVEAIFAGHPEKNPDILPELRAKACSGVPDTMRFDVRDSLRPTDHVHKDLCLPILDAGKIYMDFHSKCILSRSTSLCKHLCDGQCKLWSVVSVAICLSLHETIGNTFFSYLANYAHVHESDLRKYIGDALCCCVQDLRWMCKCLYVNEINAGSS